MVKENDAIVEELQWLRTAFEHTHTGSAVQKLETLRSDLNNAKSLHPGRLAKDTVLNMWFTALSNAQCVHAPDTFGRSGSTLTTTLMDKTNVHKIATVLLEQSICLLAVKSSMASRKSTQFPRTMSRFEHRNFLEFKGAFIK